MCKHSEDIVNECIHLKNSYFGNENTTDHKVKMTFIAQVGYSH